MVESPALLPMGFVGIQPLWGGFRDVAAQYPMGGVRWGPTTAPLQALLVSSHPTIPLKSGLCLKIPLFCWNSFLWLKGGV